MLWRDGLLLDLSVTGEFAWTLIHFLWQGALLAALLWLVLRFVRPSSHRYVISCTFLSLMLLAPLATYWSLQGRFDDPGALTLPDELLAPSALLQASTNGGAARVRTPHESTQRAPRVTAVRQAARTFSLPSLWSSRIQDALPWIVLTWGVFVLVLSVRQVVAVVWLRRMLRCNTSPLRYGHERLTDLPARMGIRRPVEFLECPLVEVPATVGWRQPVVLVPTTALDRLSHGELDALLAHEIAHIRRNDYVINLVQSLVESGLAFHPAVWWVSARVREEREVCCDELAASAVGSRKGYAAALATMEELRAGNSLSGTLALSAAGGPLLRRIRRLAIQGSAGRYSRAAGAALVAPLVTLAVLFLVTSHLVATIVNVRPPRGLADVQSLSSQIYSALGVVPSSQGREAGGGGRARLIASSVAYGEGRGQKL